jgi:hypothetical protein
MAEERAERWWKKRDRKRAERADVDPERFFERDYPLIVALHLDRYRWMRGEISIVVRGSAEWTLHLGDVDRPVSRGRSPDALVRLAFVPTAFGELLRGILDVKRALASGALTIHGDASLVEDLAQILSPKSSLLQTRALSW